MKPHPAFTHLALGKGADRISLYGLRMMGIRASENGIYDLELELDSVKEEEDDKPVTLTDTMEGSSDQVRIIEPPWPCILPVVCTVGPPPKVSVDQYFTHVDPMAMSRHALPVWQQPQ